MKIVLVAAIGDNSVIGREGQLPWRLKSDLQHFRKLTLNRPVIMGRKTHESIEKVARGPYQHRAHARSRVLLRVAPCWRLALMRHSAMHAPMRLSVGVDEIMVIGGGDIFAATMPDGRSAGNHPCARFARWGCAVPGNRSGDLARGIARGSLCRTG